MEPQPLITVIIPAFNYAQYLPLSIQSILDQTYKNWECIVVDDGSTDNTSEVMNQLVAKDSRIKYVQQKNAGPTVARNYGLKLAAGAFIQFLDADDLLEKEKLRKHLELFVANPKVDIVYGGTKYFDHNQPGQLFNNLELKPGPTWMLGLSGAGENMISALLKSNLMVISSPLIKKSLFEKNGVMNESLYFNEDWELWLRFAVNGASFLFHEEQNTNVNVRVHSSYSKDNFKMFVNGLMVCLMYDDKLTDYKYKKILKPKINYHTKTIDSKILDVLETGRDRAVEMCKYVYEKTSVARYKIYSKKFAHSPIWICRLMSFYRSAFAKLKGLIVYGG